MRRGTIGRHDFLSERQERAFDGGCEGAKPSLLARRSLFHLHSMANRLSYAFAAFISVLVLASAAAEAAPQFKMGFIYSGPFTDFGYNYNQELARIYVSKQLLAAGYNVTTELYENSTYAQADAAVSSLGARNFDLVVFTTNYFNSLLNASRLSLYPNTKFIVQAMPGPSNNSVGLASAAFTYRYVAGAMCGAVTKTNKIGFIAPLPFSFVISQVNAFALAARRINPNVQVDVIFVNSFLDPLLSAKATEYLIKQRNVDCGVSQQDDDTPERVFHNNKVPSAGANGDKRITAGNYVFFSALDDSGTWYWRIVRSILDGSFATNYSRAIFETSLGDGITLSSFSPLMSYETIRIVQDVTNAVSNKSERIFCGPALAAEGYALEGDGCIGFRDVNSMSRFFSYVSNPLNMTLELAQVRLSVRPSSGLGIALFVITSILAAACFLFIFDISYNRDAEIIRTASPFFCVLILVGFVISLMSVYGWADRPTFSICQMRIWLGGVGFAIVFGALVVKNFRIRQIFSNESLEVFAITNKDLLLQGVLPAVVVEIIILAVWYAPPRFSLLLSSFNLFPR